MKVSKISCERPPRSLHVKKSPEKCDRQIHNDNWPDPFRITNDPLRIFFLPIFVCDVSGVVHKIFFVAVRLKFILRSNQNLIFCYHYWLKIFGLDLDFKIRVEIILYRKYTRFGSNNQNLSKNCHIWFKMSKFDL